MLLRWLGALLIAAAARGELVDRVAVAVGTKVITESEIELRIRLTAFQNGSVPDHGLQSRRQTSQRLIEQKLIEREMAIGHYPNLPQERAKALIAEYLTGHFDADAPGMVVALMEYALVAEDLEIDLSRQTDLLTFLNLRFRPAVQVTAEEARRYFEDQAPGSDKTDQAFSTLRAAIERQLIAQRADKELDLWLADQKTRARIVYVDRELAPEPGP